MWLEFGRFVRCDYYFGCGCVLLGWVCCRGKYFEVRDWEIEIIDWIGCEVVVRNCFYCGMFWGWVLGVGRILVVIWC